MTTIARQLHTTHQRAARIMAAAMQVCVEMRGHRADRLYAFTFADGSALTIEGNRVSFGGAQ
ncbi:hypothetical protein Dolphis_78 [Pseudomonas phage Dolphis]|nr:hypothetical protein Dolphis_78 [Pseudomonas phage Dolphis]